MKRILHRIFLIVILFCAVDVYAQNSMSVQFTQDASHNTRIGMFTRGKIIYGSINYLATVFKLQTQYYSEAGKLDIRSDKFTIRVTSNNPFIAIIDQKQNASIIQIPHNVLFAANAFFAPMESFVPIINRILTDNLTFEKTKPAINVGPILSASQFDIVGLKFEEKSNGSLVRILCLKKLSDYESWTKPTNDGTWIYVTISDAKADVGKINNIKPKGIFKDVMVFQSLTFVQLTFKIKGQVNSTELIPAEKSNDILLTIHTPSDEQSVSRKEPKRDANLDHERNRWKLDVVVIDAGHGGDDPGAIGLKHTKEKDITLAIALKLGKLIEKKLPMVKVVYTRKSDQFIELYRRGQIANQNGGKLFVSIHCNAARHKPNPANGFEIYLLRPGKTDAALHIAERENEVVKLEKDYEKRYQQLTEENFILLTMAQSAYVKYSEQFADILQQEMGKHLDVENNGVKQAGFYVLVGASMPNVLVETAYLSNKHDEKILRSTNGQERIAEAIYNGVKRYKLEYEKSLEEGKDIGESR
jgi:N-acetylmuramoyl-L-alanine amidase